MKEYRKLSDLDREEFLRIAGIVHTRSGVSAIERFNSRYEAGDPDECWDWSGMVKRNNGYGQIQVTGIGPVAAHQFAYLLHTGKVPEGLELLHSCDRRICVNPAHLSVGTRKQNAHDSSLKGRAYRGGAVKKLNPGAVREIRRRWASGESGVVLANAFDVSRPAIVQVVNWRTWKHVTQEDTTT
jgi:hypothetical protein